MEDLTTEQYSLLISNSWISGQRKQAIEQFRQAMADSVNATSLLFDIYHEIGAENAISLACAILEAERA